MKVALVTGASRNIGLGLVDGLSADGFHTIGVARDGEALASALAATARPDATEAVSCDLSSREGCLALAEQVLDRHGRVDVLIHNAVHRATFPMAEHPYEEFERVHAVVIGAAFSLIQAFTPGMAAEGWGRIVTIGGLSGQRGSVGRTAVVSAKAGLIGLTKAVATEFGPSGITANVVSPGPIDVVRDERTSTGDASTVGALYRKNPTPPVGRRGTPGDVLAACRYLISEEAGYITGQTLSLNGGLWMP